MSPHTQKKGSRKQKRIQIRDAEGWTHIAVSGRVALRSPLPVFKDQFVCAEAPGGLTFKRLNEQYVWHKRRWQESQSWDAVKRALQSDMTTANTQIGKCVCIGLGSPSGLLRGGCVDRRGISLFQLAALVSILDFLSQLSPSMKIETIYAQDPVFNNLDRQLLESLAIEVVQDPVAFSLVDRQTFLYSPGAERSHLVKMLPLSPALFFGGPLESNVSLKSAGREEEILTEFLQTTQSILLPPFEHNEHAFWKMGIYWKVNNP